MTSPSPSPSPSPTESEERQLAPWEKNRIARLKGREEMFREIRSVLSGTDEGEEEVTDKEVVVDVNEEEI